MKTFSTRSILAPGAHHSAPDRQRFDKDGVIDTTRECTMVSDAINVCLQWSITHPPSADPSIEVIQALRVLQHYSGAGALPRLERVAPSMIEVFLRLRTRGVLPKFPVRSYSGRHMHGELSRRIGELKSR